ncbi:MAG: IS66-like element accessory protein TnpA [Solimonas sp.]
MAVAEVITVERRRRWKLAEKQRLVGEALEPGASVSEVAKRHGLHPSQLFAWKKLARDGGLRGEAEFVDSGGMSFAPVIVRSEPMQGQDRARHPISTEGLASSIEASRGRMEIALRRGRRITVFADVDAAALARVLEVLGR